MLSYVKFYANGFGRNVISADSPKIEGIEVNGPLRLGEIWWRSHWPSFCLRHRGFDRVWAGCRARDRVGPKGGCQWFAIPHFCVFFHILSPYGTDSPFKMYWTHTHSHTHTHAQKSEIFRYWEDWFIWGRLILDIHSRVYASYPPAEQLEFNGASIRNTLECSRIVAAWPSIHFPNCVGMSNSSDQLQTFSCMNFTETKLDSNRLRLNSCLEIREKRKRTKKLAVYSN